MQRDKCYEQHPRATASSGSTAVVGSTATVPVFRPGGLVLDEAYGNFVELLHFCSHSSLLVIIQFPSLLCEAIVEVICDVSTWHSPWFVYCCFQVVLVDRLPSNLGNCIQIHLFGLR